MSDPKIKLTINDKAVEVDKGTTVFNAAAQAGIFIPHYCYHPDLSIAGVCRMCMVDIEKNPRLQISCNTVATEGMVVKTDTPKVKDTVKSVLELHLINHPLDCPICDKAGECKLQDFYAKYGLYQSRMEYDNKVHKPKVVDIGTIVLDSERCILCSRCVRFTNEVTHTDELGIFNRGDRSELRTYDHGPLKNDYTGNLADICPVGALTAKDFRFKQRVWFLDDVESVCAQCAHGCNTKVSKNPNTHKLYRVEPRRNPEVNKSWMCDRGRWDFHYVHDENRIRVPRKQADGKSAEQTWHSVFQDLKAALEADGQRFLVGISTQMTNEEMLEAVSGVSAFGVTDFVWLCDEKAVAEKQPFDGILKHRDLTPNAAGFEKVMQGLSKTKLTQAAAIQGLKSGKYSYFMLLGLEGYDLQGVAEMMLATPKEVKVILHTTSEVAMLEKCEWVLPGVSCYEKSGTVMNAQGRLQKLVAAVPKQHTARDVHQVMFGIHQGGDRKPCPGNRFQEVYREQMTEKVIPGLEKDWRGLNPMGVGWEGAS